MLKAYYYLTKPGIIYGNVLTSAAGFLLAARGTIDLIQLTGTLAGTALVIGSACVINNYIDRDIDAKMARTKKRALVNGTINGPQALTYAGVLGLAGFAILAAQTNLLTLTIGIIGYIDYIVLYTWSKRHTTHATLVGSIAGAMPITAGYTAASNTFDTGALLVCLVMVIWQMPHFYAIALFRRDDYAAAHIPVLPLAQGIRRTKVHIMFYIAAYIAAVTAATISGVTGKAFLVVMLIVSGLWLWRGAQGFNQKDDRRWARKLFLFSLIVLLTFSVMLAANSLLP